MNSRVSFVLRGASLLLMPLAGVVVVCAQNGAKPAPPPDTSFLGSYGIYLGVVIVLGLVAFILLRRKASSETVESVVQQNDGGVKLKYKEKADEAPATSKPKAEPKVPVAVLKPRKGGLASLPISSFTKIQRPNYYIELPESSDPALREAIATTSEESEADTAERTQALKMLSTFKTSNAVTAIAQSALYDLSSKLRSDAVGILAGFDHESVFESIVTACADPTREVRAAGARALFKLTFDRAHAWARIVESGDLSRMRHAARSAIEGDLVERSFDRLIHRDRNIAYEAFTLTALLIRSGETEPIYKVLASHNDENVKLALLHVLGAIKEDRTFEDLSNLLLSVDLSPEIAAKVNEVRSCLQLTHA